jgi:chaperonin GroES
MNVKPTQGRVFIQPESPAPRTFLEIPHKYQWYTMPEEGVVLAIGRGHKTKKGAVIEPEFSVGDRVRWKKQYGQWVPLGDGRVIMLRQDEVQAVLT